MERSVLRRVARRVLFPAIEAMWAGGFTIVGRVFGLASVPCQVGNSPERVLIVAPHPDDETLGCGGAIALHAARGDTVCVAIATDGGNSRAQGLDHHRMIATRAIEARNAVQYLGDCHLLQLQLPEGSWKTSQGIVELSRLISATRPTVIYAPSRVDFHPEHVRVASALANALAGTKAGTERLLAVRVYELQVPLTPVLANCIVPVGPVRNRKLRALHAYRTQAGSFGWERRQARYLRALYGSGQDIEVFWQMSPSDYSRLMKSPRATGNAFRSMRPRPFTDGLAWLAGMRARTALRRHERALTSQGAVEKYARTR